MRIGREPLACREYIEVQLGTLRSLMLEDLIETQGAPVQCKRISSAILCCDTQTLSLRYSSLLTLRDYRPSVRLFEGLVWDPDRNSQVEECTLNGHFSH